MFLSERSKGGNQEAGLCQVEAVSLGGDAPAIADAGIQYGAKLFGPGGIVWVPRRGQNVLVIKTGSLGEESCMVGAESSGGEGLEPGELRLFSEGCALELKNDGSVHISGKVYINGEELGTWGLS